MLVLSRKVGEIVHFGGDITVTVLALHAGKVRIGIKAPAKVAIVRKEIHRPPAEFRGVADEAGTAEGKS